MTTLFLKNWSSAGTDVFLRMKVIEQFADLSSFRNFISAKESQTTLPVNFTAIYKDVN